MDSIGNFCEILWLFDFYWNYCRCEDSLCSQNISPPVVLEHSLFAKTVPFTFPFFALLTCYEQMHFLAYFSEQKMTNKRYLDRHTVLSILQDMLQHIAKSTFLYFHCGPQKNCSCHFFENIPTVFFSSPSFSVGHMEFQSMKLLDFLNLFGFPDLFWISPLFFRISSWFFYFILKVILSQGLNA